MENVKFDFMIEQASMHTFLCYGSTLHENVEIIVLSPGSTTLNYCCYQMTASEVNNLTPDQESELFHRACYETGTLSDNYEIAIQSIPVMYAAILARKTLKAFNERNMLTTEQQQQFLESFNECT